MALFKMFLTCQCSHMLMLICVYVVNMLTLQYALNLCTFANMCNVHARLWSSLPAIHPPSQCFQQTYFVLARFSFFENFTHTIGNKLIGTIYNFCQMYLQLILGTRKSRTPPDFLQLEYTVINWVFVTGIPYTG